MNGLILPILVSLLGLAIVVLAAGLLLNAVRRRLRPQSTRRIVVLGMGGAGGNAVDRMVRGKQGGAELIACNTDLQALRRSTAPRKLQIGRRVTRGLGAGGDPAVGQRAAEDDARAIASVVAGADVVFVAGGMGGGTGSGAAPVAARLAREKGALTIGVVTRPFAFEGVARAAIAETAVEALRGQVDALITIPNESVRKVLLDNVPFTDAFGVVDQVLVDAVQGLIDIVVRPGFVNLDFADVRAVLREAGPALIGIGRASGEERAREAARQATANPLLEVGIGGARTVLLHVSGPPELSLGEVSRAAEEVRAQVDPRADVLFGASVDERLGDEVRVTVVATGLGPPGAARAGAGAAASAEGGASGPATRRVGSAAEGATVAAAAPSTPPATDEAEVPGFLVGDGPRATPRSASR